MTAEPEPSLPVRSEYQVSPALQLAGGYAWRLVAVAVAAYLVLQVVSALRLVALALFGALLLTALLRPLLDLVGRVLPRGPAVAVTILTGLATLFGALGFVAGSAAGQSAQLAQQFGDGAAGITGWLRDGPLHVSGAQLSGLLDQAQKGLLGADSSVVDRVIGGAGVAADGLAAVALTVFCTICLLHSGPGMWRWFGEQIPAGARPRLELAGTTAWATFSSYTRGTVLVAATNAGLVCIALLVLRVPLAVPLSVIVLFASFLPLIGAPLALALATVVALAGRGPVVALIVAGLIVVIGQLESHVLQPLVMSRAVRLHPIVVALSVVSGALLAGVAGAVVAVPVVSVSWAVHSALRADRAGSPGDDVSPPAADPPSALNGSVVAGTHAPVA